MTQILPPFWERVYSKGTSAGRMFFAAHLFQKAEHPPCNLVVTYRLKTATTKTAINTTTPAAMIASSTFGIFNASFDLASFDLIQARPGPSEGA
jgi:hypothetical protein